MKDDTRIVAAGRQPHAHDGIVNPPVYHASTVLFPSVKALEDASKPPTERKVVYGRRGTPTTWALEDAIAELEGGDSCVLCPSGLAAITTALLAILKTGDHLLMTDSTYGPTRTFCDTILKNLGIETTYYDPCIGADITRLMRENTRVVFTESPGSLTFEVQDIPAIARTAHERGALVLLDNTWASPLFFKPFEHGVDVSIQAGTKYIVGHSDVMLGAITTRSDLSRTLRGAHGTLGMHVGPDDVYLAQRGFRTLGVRLARHQETGLALAHWLQRRPEVARVLHPALPDDPGHELWQRDFLGASGLFGIVLKPTPKQAVAAMLDGLALFGMGYSWGGYESLILPADPRPIRTATRWDAEGPLLRLHAGLEDPDDLIADLEAGFVRLNAAAGAEA
jgi:cystathionine beta-lyase